jgi:hypothetical protein
MSCHAMQPNAAATKLASSCMHGVGGLVTYGPDVTYGLNTDSARCWLASDVKEIGWL